MSSHNIGKSWLKTDILSIKGPPGATLFNSDNFPLSEEAKAKAEEEEQLKKQREKLADIERRKLENEVHLILSPL